MLFFGSVPDYADAHTAKQAHANDCRPGSMSPLSPPHWRASTSSRKIPGFLDEAVDKALQLYLISMGY